MTRKILIYGDVNLNYLDGSGAWLVALTQCLVGTESDVHVLLKADILDDERLSVLDDLNGATIHTPFDDRKSGFAGMKPRQAASRIVVLDRRHHFDIVISRGYDIASHLAISGQFDGRMWPYLTEGPAFDFERTEHHERLLEAISKSSRRLFFQTEEARSVGEALNPGFTGKTLVMNPIVPDAAFRAGVSSPKCGLSLVYAGKFARLWNTLEMTQLPTRAADEGLDIRLTMVGNKFQKTGDDDEWLAEMKAAAAADDPRVKWLGGLPRGQVLDVVETADLGMCWRDPALDSSPEISTKMLECSALGTPPVLNRTAMHESLLGPDYPFFVDEGDVLATLRRAASSPQLLEDARTTARRAVERYSMSATRSRFEQYFARAESDSDQSGLLVRDGHKHRVLVAGHDFKFASDLIELLQQRDDIELRIDKWQRLAVHNEASSMEAARWAETIICEWAGPNAVFFARHARENTRLIVRFHGFEIRGNWLKDLDVSRVDAFVFVSDFYRKHVLSELGWPEDRSTVIYNTIDIVDLDRPKLADARFHLGMAGYVPMLKRPDRAVALLKDLLSTDERYYLHIRGRVPWQYQWEWNKPSEQDAYRAFFSSIANDSLLRRHIVFEPFSPDMGNWFRRIGWMVSPSMRETFHLAPVEGMASGAPALVWNRDGADEVFGCDYVRATTAELADLVRENSRLDAWEDLSHRAKQKAANYDVMTVRSQWVDLLRLPRGSAPVLNGTNMVEPQPGEPLTAASAVAALHRAFEERGASAAQEMLNQQPVLLEQRQRLVSTWRRLEGWDTGESIPVDGLDPLYAPQARTVVTSDSLGTKFKGCTVVPVVPESVTGIFDHDALIAADSYCRAAIRTRAAAIAIEGPLSQTLGGLIASRRLGIAFHGRTTVTPLAAGREQHLYQRIAQRVKRSSMTPTELLSVLSAPRYRGGRGIGRPLSTLTIGIIADEFTSRTIGAAVKTVPIPRRGGDAALSGIDALILESAWEGPGRSWFHGVAYHGEDEAKDLWRILEGCRRRNVPVLFWNKEDPVHFRSFALAASRCDHVFTTDAGRIPAYLEQNNINVSVASLPFYAEPSLHNPLPGGRPFNPTVEFAGSYYGKRYPKRTAELRMILETAAEVGLTIYDRQKDLPNSPYRLPEDLQVFSVGSVPYEEILDVYKSHPVNINVNSVSDSPSMFSRRVVEIAASGSGVLSGAGRGMGEVLGEAFPALHTEDEWRSALGRWMTDEDERVSAVWAQMRAVLLSHRCDQALALMLRCAGLNVSARAVPSYGWIVSSPEQIRAAERQSLRPIVVTDNKSLGAIAESQGLETATGPEGVDWVTDTVVPVSDTHFEDLLLATLFIDADVLSVRYSADRTSPMIQPGMGERATALWRSTLDGPDEALAPWVWRNTRHSS
ncbi:MAG: glycosyltransferase [Actinomyces ruminicola]|nr:glycosyltransferase [Actinomyces ruminicola]